MGYDQAELLEQVRKHLNVDLYWLTGRQVLVQQNGESVTRAEFLGVDCEGPDRPRCCVRYRGSPLVERVHYGCIRLVETPDPDASPTNEVAALAESCRELRGRILFNSEITAFGALSEQHFLLALTALEQAERHAKIAAVHLAAEISADVRRRSY